MKLADIVAAQVKTAEETQADLQRVTRTAADLARPTATLNARVARVETRIKALERQKADTVRRLDEAIVEQTKLRDQLLKDAENIGSRFPDVGDRPTRPRPGRRPLSNDAATAKKPASKTLGTKTATVRGAAKPKTPKKPAASRTAKATTRKPRGS